MKKLFVVMGLFVLLAFGTVVLLPPEAKAVEPTSFESAINGYDVQPMAGCTRYCSRCVPVGHGGACTLTGSCC